MESIKHRARNEVSIQSLFFPLLSSLCCGSGLGRNPRLSGTMAGYVISLFRVVLLWYSWWMEWRGQQAGWKSGGMISRGYISPFPWFSSLGDRNSLCAVKEAVRTTDPWVPLLMGRSEHKVDSVTWPRNDRKCWDESNDIPVEGFLGKQQAPRLGILILYTQI